MSSLAKITLTNPVDVDGQPKKEIHIRHYMRAGDMAAVGRYALRNKLDQDAGELIGKADIGAMLVLADSLCQLPIGTCEQLEVADIPTVMEGIIPFFKRSPKTGKK